jgi:transcriptional regulator with XRE-family HTH domain
MDKRALGEKIKRLRGDVPQRDFAANAKVAYGAVQSIEWGDGNPTLDTLIAISKKLNVPVSELLEEPRVGPSPLALSSVGEFLQKISTLSPDRLNAVLALVYDDLDLANRVGPAVARVVSGVK